MHWRKRKKLRRIAKHHGFTHYHDFKFYTDMHRINSKSFNEDLFVLDDDKPSFSMSVLNNVIRKRNDKCYVNKIITYDMYCFPSHKRTYRRIAAKYGPVFKKVT